MPKGKFPIATSTPTREHIRFCSDWDALNVIFYIMDKYELKLDDMAQKYCKRLGCKLVGCLMAQGNQDCSAERRDLMKCMEDRKAYLRTLDPSLL